jgi:hypothetical protein
MRELVFPQHQARLIQKSGSNDSRAAEPARDQRPGGPSPLHSPRRRAVSAAEGKERLGGRRPSPLSFFTLCPPEMRDRLADQVMCSVLVVRIATGFYFLFASVSSNIQGPDNPDGPAVPHVPFICEEANRTQGKQSPLGIHGYGPEAALLWRLARSGERARISSCCCRSWSGYYRRAV